uniref:Uncharacterized protein n=1 Tax=Candidatus Kentrum sp. SD TaxID=2126332 RepID=A0A450YQ19_9GAMM|nr:MAG: hypothetical protein BECKSD772F_GA0070984_11532 [Candidatus Kentron sp. SD]VFK47812.1 MAG: hypothetical protein BECKSD772E_GA0070983_110610 [Candidatus Kentron sp. SD]
MVTEYGKRGVEESGVLEAFQFSTAARLRYVFPIHYYETTGWICRSG